MSRYQTGLTGELLVAAELARMGWAVAIPSGNLPKLDLLISRDGVQQAIQVKACLGSTVQIKLKSFLDITFDKESGIQTIVGNKHAELDNTDVVLAFVAEDRKEDRFFALKRRDFVELLIEAYAKYLAPNGGKRPKSGDSDHHSILLDHVSKKTEVYKSLADYFGKPSL